MFNLRRLHLLRELQARGTVTAVADAHHFSRSAVSQQLSKLEREVGVTLFERVGRKLRLTEAGAILARHAEAVLALLDLAEAELQASQSQARGVVRVGVFQTAAVWLLPEAIQLLGERYPLVRIEAQDAGPEQTLDALRLGDLDVVIGQSYEHSPLLPIPGCDYEVILRDAVELALPVSHELASERAPVRLDMLEEQIWVAGEAGTGFGTMMRRICQNVGGFVPDVRYHSSDYSVVMALVGGGHAVALVPSLANVASDPRIVVRPLLAEISGRDIFWATRPGMCTQTATAAFLAVIGETASRRHSTQLAFGS